ncbi:MAG: phage tail tape measure C-terminal domain-containing protein, partial [Candidatus Nanopelagicus sp.]
DAAKKYLNIGQEEGPKGRSYSQEDARRMQEDFDQRTAAIKRGQEAMAKFNGEIAKSKLESQEVLKLQDQSLVATGMRLALERSLIGATEDQKEMQTNLFELESARLDKQREYASAIKKLKQEQSLTKDEEANKLLGARIGILQAEAKESDAISIKRNGYITQQLQLNQNAKMIEAARLQDQQNMVKAIEDQISRQQELGTIMQSANDKMVDTKFAGAQQGRTPMEQKMASIQEEARKAALEAGRAFSAGFEGMDLTVAQSQELANGLDQIAQKYKAIADEQTKQLDISRSWDAGWKSAFDNYMDNATNAAMRAGEVFSSITGNMSSAIDKFVETGKFSFGDFARSIIQDLIKIELKAQATKLLGAIGGGGGIFSAIGSLFGFANGGNPPINKPSIVGEKGPELFVPKTAGTIIPNGGSMGGSGGGMAPTSNVTNNYNISAIDSKSVAQFFAENRKTMLGTMQLAQKELPYGNR